MERAKLRPVVQSPSWPEPLPPSSRFRINRDSTGTQTGHNLVLDRVRRRDADSIARPEPTSGRRLPSPLAVETIGLIGEFEYASSESGRNAVLDLALDRWSVLGRRPGAAAMAQARRLGELPRPERFASALRCDALGRRWSPPRTA